MLSSRQIERHLPFLSEPPSAPQRVQLQFAWDVLKGHVILHICGSFGLKMVNQNDDLGSPTLAHEMTHALVNRNKGIIENLKNDEVLSIYMELVVAYELDETGSLLHKMMLSRLQSLKNDMLNSYKDVYNGYLPFTNYIDSSLYAFSLFEKYKNGSEKVRKAIRKEINKTLLGKRTLEDTLQVMDASQKEGSQIIQDYVKKLMK